MSHIEDILRSQAEETLREYPDAKVTRLNDKFSLIEVETPLPRSSMATLWEDNNKLHIALEYLYDQIAKNDFTDSHGHKAQKMDAFTKAGQVLGK